MRFHHIATVALPGLLLVASFILPRPTQSLEIADNIHEFNENENRDSEFVHELLNLQLQVSLRSLLDDETCTNACDSDNISTLRASVEMDVDTTVEQQQEEEGEGGNGMIGRIFGRFTGLFNDNEGMFGRLMNRLFNAFNRKQRDDPKYPVPTENILPLLSTYSAKLKSLAKLIRQESVNDAALSKTPDAIQMMYNISADNVELVATALDPILDEMRQSATMDVRTISCNMMQILTLLRDVTVPNIESIAKLIYTNSNNAEMKDRFNQYTQSSENVASSTALTSTSSSEYGTCVVDASRTTSTSRIFINGLFNFLFNSSIDVGPIGHIVSIILLIVLFPLSIVVSMISIIVLVAFLLANSIIYLFGNQETDDGLLAFLLIIIFAISIGSPIIIIYQILKNIKEFFGDILDPFLPDRPTPAPFIFTPYPTFFPTPAPNVSAPVVAPASTTNIPINAPVSGRDGKLSIEVTYRLSSLLESPIDTIVRALQNENEFADALNEDEEVMDCELAALKCKNDALMDILPF